MMTVDSVAKKLSELYVGGKLDERLSEEAV